MKQYTAPLWLPGGHLQTIWWARWRRVPLIFRGDSHLIGRGALPWRRRWPLRLLYRQFAAITCVGAANRDYFRALGVPERKLFFAPHAVDATHFNHDDPVPHTAAAHRNNLPHIRANLDDRETLRLARSFQVPVLINSNTRDGSLRQAAGELGIKVVLFEGGERLRFNEQVIRIGNTLVYIDQEHMTLEYSRLLAPAIGTLADRALAHT